MCVLLPGRAGQDHSRDDHRLPGQGDPDLHRAQEDGGVGPHPPGEVTRSAVGQSDDSKLFQATAEDLIKQKFEFPLAKTGEEEDQYLRGEFDVIKELVEKLPGAREAKTKIDRLIDLCGPTPKGTGVQNLRESIIRTKWKYDVAPEDKQVAWRQLILNFMERYFYLICFSTYARELGPAGFQQSFVSVGSSVRS